MQKVRIWPCAALGLTLAALPTAPASAKNMMLYNQRQGCGNLVKQTHPDLERKARRAEVKKCKDDPDAYNRASGL